MDDLLAQATTATPSATVQPSATPTPTSLPTTTPAPTAAPITTPAPTPVATTGKTVQNKVVTKVAPTPTPAATAVPSAQTPGDLSPDTYPLPHFSFALGGNSAAEMTQSQQHSITLFLIVACLIILVFAWLFKKKKIVFKRK